MRLTLRIVGPAAVLTCEAIGFLALSLAPEVERWLFLFPLLVGVLAFGLKVKARDVFILLGVVSLVLTMFLLTRAGLSTGVVVARCLIPSHSLLWLAREERTYRFWRLGLAFLGIVLAAILAPEVHMFIMIFLLVIVGSLALAFGFLEKNFRERDEELINRPIRPEFVGAVLAFSVLIFLSSLLIFPLLPRSHWSGNDTSSSGYTEQVSFQGATLFWAPQDSRPVMWVFRSGKKPWEELIPFALLRGSSLDAFNGVVWRPIGRKPAKLQGLPTQNEAKLEILRQSLPTEVLPVPYGTGEVALDREDGSVSRYEGGEWSSPGAHDKGVKYQAVVGQILLPSIINERPSARTLEIDQKKFERLSLLAKEIGVGATGTQEQIEKIRSYYRENGFTAELGAVAAATEKVHPINTFLFEKKSGHCELYASATALLLRAMGTPARVIVGFRVRMPARGDVLTVRASDAHAWVEAWSDSRGWIVVDPTPSLYRGNEWFTDHFGEAYDWIGAYWHRYILGYEYDAKNWRTFVRPVSLFALAVGLLWGMRFLLRAWRKFRSQSLRVRLPKILEEFEDDLVHQAGVYPDSAYVKVKKATEWLKHYQEIRFGAEEPTKDSLTLLRREARAVIREVVRAQRPAG